MRKLTYLLVLLCSSITAYGQDTTWVQTFTFDSISTRRANFNFPPELNSMRFEKVLMYYRLKCDPQTPWDQYNCGEWDYLAYTRIFDHTGQYDSVRVDSVRYLNNYASTPSYTYDPFTGSRTDVYTRTQYSAIGSPNSMGVLGGSGSGDNYPFLLSSDGSHYQMLLTAAELSNAGVVAGDIRSLSLFVSGITGNGELWQPRISIKSTSDNTLNALHRDGFTEVYNMSSAALYGNELQSGQNDFIFYQPFTWNGTDNIIIEFVCESGNGPQGNLIAFENEQTSSNLAANYDGRNGVMEFDGSGHGLLELSDVDLNDVTVMFWAKGMGNTGVNTSILEAFDTVGNRILNVHMPWSDNRMYWDAGTGSNYDRIDRAMTTTDIDNEWHHWAFVKDQTAGTMKIFRDGVLWHSGSGLSRPVGYMHRLIVGANKDRSNHWTGRMDEFQMFSAPLSDATIANWYNQKTIASHPNWADLLVYYDFDNASTAADLSGNDYLWMPNQAGMINFSERPVISSNYANRKRVLIGQGGAPAVSNVEVPFEVTKEPEVVFEFAPVNRHFEIANAFLATPGGSEDLYDAGGSIVASVPFTGGSVLTNTQITYYEQPLELVNDVEIGRFITPYGIGFDLGSGGFTWIYDVTDYQMYMHDLVDLAAHNTQELIDLKFAFIEGIPPRDVQKRQPIWSEWKSYQYSSMDNDAVLQSTSVELSDTASMFKIKTRLTGHGQVGNGACCEWQDKQHMISVDGVERFSWSIWRETACGDNPNTAQGGTWPYAREGWCPGDLVPEYDHELTPYVTPGSTVALDYDIEDVPVSDPGQASGNYIVAMDLISYSAPNFQRDAAIVDVLNPNKYEYYRKWNPTCSNPRVILQNTGEQTMTSCRLRIWISYGDFIDYQWNGNLGFLQQEIVEIPVTDDTWWQDYNGTMTFSAQVYDVNGAGDDEYAQNNLKEVKFEAPASVSGPFLTWFTTNNKAAENKWRMLDANGNIIFEQTSFTNSTTYQDTFDLAPGCYSIIIEDSDSDGLGYWYSSQVEGETNGAFRLKVVGGPIIETFPRDFGNYHRYDFSVGFTLGEEEKVYEESLGVYPNPNAGQFDVELSGKVNNDATLTIMDMTGRVMHVSPMQAGANFASAHVDMTHVLPGMYIVKVTTGDRVYTTEFIKQ